MPQKLNSSSAGCAEPRSSKAFTVSLNISLLFGNGLIALPFPLPCSSGADRVASQQTDTTGGLELFSLPCQTQLCHARRTPQAWGRGRRKGEQPWEATAAPGYCPGEARGCLLLYSLTPRSFPLAPVGRRPSCWLPSSTPQPPSHRRIPQQAQHGAMSPLWACPFKNLTSRIPGATPRYNKKKTPSPRACQHLQLSSLRQQKKETDSLQGATDINPSGSCLISPRRNLITQLTTHQGGEIHLSLDACRKQVLLLKGGSNDVLGVYI